jgi:hypothetical protein
MSSGTDEDLTSQSVGLLRRIHPDQIVEDKNTGRRRPSSAAFKDPNLSVDIEPLLHKAGLDWRFSLRNHPGYSLVRFPAQSAVNQGLTVVPSPLTNNPAHAEVVGKKTPGKANALRDSSVWVYVADGAAAK